MTPQEFRSFMLATVEHAAVGEVSIAEAQDALAREFDGMLDALACGFDLGVRTLIAQREQARREAGEAEALVAEVRAREQRLREALNDVELSDGAFRALCDSYLNPVPVVTADDQKWAAEALRPIGGEAGGGERR